MDLHIGPNQDRSVHAVAGWSIMQVLCALYGKEVHVERDQGVSGMIEILSSGRKRILPPELTKQSLGER